MITRRKMLIALGAGVLAAPLAAHAQQPGKVPRIGVILTGGSQYARDAFFQGLRERGWVEGRNILIEYRPVGDKLERVPDIVAELVGLKVDVIVASANQVIIALKRATQTIPIVMSVVGDPVGAGFIASLARPGGNITGLSNVAEGLSAKRLEILKEIDPRISRVAVLRNSSIPTHGVLLKETEIAARALRLTLVPVDFRDANDFEEAFKAMARERSNALVVFPDPVTAARGTLIVSLAARHGLAAMYPPGRVHRGGRTRCIRSEQCRPLAPFGQLRGSHFERGSAGRSAGRAADEVRADRQHENRQSARHHDPAGYPRARGQGDRMTTRRELLLLGAAGFASRVARAQQKPAGKPMRVGILASPARVQFKVQERAFVDAMREAGWVEGRNVVYDFVFANEDRTRLPVLAAELVGRGPDLVFVNSTESALAALAATRTIPIVFGAAADPVENGVVKSLAWPGGNATGIANIGWELGAKRLQLLKQAAPKVSRVGVLVDPRWEWSARERKLIEEAGGTLGVTVIAATAKEAREVNVAVASLVKGRAEALVPTATGLFLNTRGAILKLAAGSRIPVVGHRDLFVEDGALMSYSARIVDQIRRAAQMADRVLKGTKPADIPVERPSRFELVVNAKTAKALGITLPPAFLAQADRVIE